MELRDALAEPRDLEILYVLPSSQMNAKSLRFIDELGLRERVRFLVDPDSAAIDRLGLRLENPEPMERGVPHPATYLLDRAGVVRFADVRRDYHVWLDAALIVEALDRLN